MWKYDPKLIKQQKIITWIICITLASILILVMMLDESIYSNPNELRSTLIFCSIMILACTLTALFLTSSLERNSKKAWQGIIKEFSLIENEYTEFSYTLKDCFKNRKMLNEIIDILKLQSNNKDFFFSERGASIIQLGIFNADCSMTNLLMRIIKSMGGKFYLFFNNEKKIFLCVKDSSDTEIYQKEITDFSELKEDMNVEDYI